MAQIKAVPEATPDPKAGKERRISETTVPGAPLALSIDVARVIHQNGGSLDRTQLAAHLKYSGTQNGTFLTRVSAAKIFGLVDQPQQSDIVRITARGVAIVAPVSESDALRAKIDAFLSVELYRTIYEDYKGRELPPDVGLANLFENTHKIIPSRALPSVKIMMQSAETAGLFTTTGTASRKMIQPVLNGGGSVTPRQDTPPANTIQHGGGSGGGGGSGSGGDGSNDLLKEIDPALVALLRRLPKSGTVLTKARRDKLIAAFTATVEWIYPDPDTDAF